MTRDAHALGRRFTALVLALLFLLQSAAQAGSGCLASVLAGNCCCEAADSEASDSEASDSESADSETADSVDIARPGVRSCCSERAEHSRSTPAGPILEQGSECGCDIAPPSSLPADKASSDVTERARGQRGADASAGFAQWIAHNGPASMLTGPCFDPPLGLEPAGPPGPTLRASPTFATTRLAQRGVIGLLSELCTARC